MKTLNCRIHGGEDNWNTRVGGGYSYEQLGTNILGADPQNWRIFNDYYFQHG